MNTFRSIDGFSVSIAKKIGRMLEGEALASSVLPQWMADELKQEGLLGVTATAAARSIGSLMLILFGKVSS